MKPELETYAASLRGYEKNRFAPLEPATRERVNTAAAAVLERYGYAASP